jgi:hypothetical protein
MRSRFVAASIGTHIGVLSLAFYAARLAPLTASTEGVAAESGLVSVELAAEEDVSTPPSPTVSRPAVQEPDNALPQPTGAQTQGAPKPRSADTEAAPGPHSVETTPSALTTLPAQQHETAPRQARPDDWLSIDQQLPDDISPAEKPKAAPRDELVERLLAKERERARIQEREEQRREQSRRELPRREATIVEGSTGVDGASHQSADAWVELTRWLPRAASSDQRWEHLASNTRFDVRVRVALGANGLVEVTTLESAPDVVVRLLSTTGHLMQNGRFGRAAQSERRFSLRIRLSQTPERELWIAHTAPDPPKPGVGSFVSPSGRRFDVWVTADP